MVAGHRGGTEPGRRKPIAHQTTSLTDTLTTHQLFLLAIIVAIGLYLYFFVYHATLVVSIESSSTAIEYQSVEVIRLNEVLHRQQQLKQPGGKQQSTVERSVTVFDLYKHANQVRHTHNNNDKPSSIDRKRGNFNCSLCLTPLHLLFLFSFFLS